MKKYLGIDYGAKRIGVAMSDDENLLAFPHTVIINSTNAIHQIAEIAERNGITDIIVGESKNSSGDHNKIMLSIKNFSDALMSLGTYVVKYEQEFFTSVEAERYINKDALHDARAAALILQRHLDKLIYNKTP